MGVPPIDRPHPAVTARNGVHLRLLPTLVACLSTLLLVAVGLVIYLQFLSGRGLISDLGGRIVERDLKSMELAFERYLGDSQRHALAIARQVGEDASLLADRGRLEELVHGLFSAEPHLDKLILLDASRQGFRAARLGEEARARIDWLNPEGPSTLHDRLARSGDLPGTAAWDAPVFDRASARTVVAMARRLAARDGRPLFVEISMAVEPLSALALAASGGSHRMYFALLNGERVLAHPLLAGGPVGTAREGALPLIETLGDGVLSALSTAAPVGLIDLSRLPDADIRQATWRGADYVVVTQQLRHQFGEHYVTVGAYRRADEAKAPLAHLLRSLWFALGVLVVALVAAVGLGHAISRPLRRVSSTAAKIGRVDFTAVEEVPASFIAELNELARSFNAMIRSLRLFGRYVPRTLVQRLIGQSVPHAASEERVMTVMFTDIAGFTRLSEGMKAADVAQFINHHLTLLGQCVEAEGGTIDKYIGDALMAFWGAPEAMPDHAEAACRAAVAIVKSIRADNAARTAEGRLPVRVRLGIHTGPLVVGDIGSPSRINYTVIGDTVNAAARLESLGKTVDPEAEVIILVSEEVKRRLPPGWPSEPLGRHKVHGRAEPIDVHRLVA
jgi:adenylate cyclase